ncbi:MAG: hypothetical protein ACLS63_06570 [Flavonifractor plautii]
MERRKRNLLVVLIGIVIVVAMVSSFGLGLFAPDTAKIVLPTPEVSQQPGGEPGEQSGLVLVDVTPETVQSVIRDTLSRPDRYTRAVTIEDFWGEGESGTTHADVWVDGGWTQTEAALPGGTVRYSIVGDGQFWLWYGGDRTALSGPADGHSADLEGQRIPTYEDVLELEQDAIAAAGYEEKGGLACIYVETGEDALGYVKYWVSVDSGRWCAPSSGKGRADLSDDLLRGVDGPYPLRTPGGCRTAQCCIRRGITGGRQGAGRPLFQPQQQEQPQGDDQFHVVPLQKEEQEDEQEQDIAGVEAVQLEAPK